MSAPQPKHGETANNPPAPQDHASLRQLQAILLDLRAVLAEVNSSESFTLNQTFIGKAKGAIRTSITDHEADTNGETSENSDAIQHLQNLWCQMEVNPLLEAPEKATSDDILKHKDRLVAQIDQAIFYLGILTIPQQVNRWLNQSTPGYALPFHEIFADELPSPEARTRLLKYMAHAPNLVRGGMIDVEGGLIYRYARDWGTRVGTMVYLLAIFALFTGMVVGICFLAPNPPSGVTIVWPTKGDIDNLLVAWGAILVGVVIHAVIQLKKQSDAGQSMLAMITSGGLPVLVSAYSGKILLKLTLAIIALFALTFTMGAPEVTITTAFLAGYSLDSFIDLFGTTTEASATAQREALASQLGVKGTP